MDQSDIRLLHALAKDADVTATKLMDKVNLSIPAVNKRIARLKESGTIRNVTILTNPDKVGKSVIAFVLVVLDRFSNMDTILKGVEADRDVLECYAVTGAAMMVENGCMDDVEKVLCLHVEPSLPTGTVGLYEGAYMAACHPYSITFHGRSAHATAPEKAIDALSMAVEAYTRIREKKAGEWAQLPKHILSLSSLQAGQVHNVIPGEATLLLSFRFYDMLTHDTIDAQIKDICRQCAEKAGGTVTFDDRISCPAVFNDPAVVAAACNAAIAAVGEGNVLPVPQRYSSEDFSHYLTKAPGALVRIGIRNEEIGCGAVCHDAAFKVDEAALKVGCEVLARFALEG